MAVRSISVCNSPSHLGANAAQRLLDAREGLCYAPLDVVGVLRARQRPRARLAQRRLCRERVVQGRARTDGVGGERLCGAGVEGAKRGCHITGVGGVLRWSVRWQRLCVQVMRG